MNESVDPTLLAHVEQVLKTCNVDGKVPMDVFWRLLDDMASVTDRIDQWSCATYERYGMHDKCRNPVHERRAS